MAHLVGLKRAMLSAAVSTLCLRSVFQFGYDLFDRVEIGTTWRQEELSADADDCFAHPLAGSKVVP